MSRHLFLAMLLASLGSMAHASQVDDWISSLQHPHYDSDELKPQNYKSKYLKYDFSLVMTPKSKFLGYIGSNYKRLRIHFRSVTRAKPDTYLVQGDDKVGKNGCHFKGSIQIQQVREYKTMDYGVDDELKNRGMKAQGLILGRYVLKEEPSQKYSGVFKGIMTAYWYADKNGNVRYNDIGLSYSDNYKNNQYVGTWSRYGSKVTKVCNWGEYRIPFSDELDVGAGEFAPDPKYYKQGWGDFREDRAQGK